jgi:hypothetical protein
MNHVGTAAWAVQDRGPLSHVPTVLTADSQKLI